MIDTAGQAPFVALAEDARVLHTVGPMETRRLSEELTVAIRRCFEAVGLPVARCGGAVVTVGPGSFTGVRAGLAALTGLAAPTGWSVLGVDRFRLFHEAVRRVAPDAPHGVTVLIDSGRDALFALPIPAGADCPPPDTALWLAPSEIAQLLTENGHVAVGDGIDRLPSAGEDNNRAAVQAATVLAISPADRAAVLATLGMQDRGGPAGSVPLPLYLRPPDAVPAPPPRPIRGSA